MTSVPAPSTSLWHRTWAELRRRRVVRAGIAYAVVAWVVLQVAEITFEPLGLPPLALTWTVLGAVLGLPLVLVLSWFFDLSPQGIALDRQRGGAAGAAFALAVVLLVVVGSGWWLLDVYPPNAAVAEAEPVPAVAASAAPANAIAVLPFDDLSPAADQGYLADGLAEELLDRLARNPGLQVAARTSSFALRGRATDVREIGRLLNVRWVLEGSLRRAEGRVRVTAQLIDAGSGFHVWSQPYDHSADDLFALQDQIAEAIAGALAQRIAGVAAAAPGAADTTDSAALDAYLQGRQAWRQRTPAGLQRAESLFTQAVERDPGFARAWSGLADTYLLQADYGSREVEAAIALAEPAVVKALERQPQLGEAWASLGLLRMTAGQYEAARRSLEHAVELDSRYEMAPMWLAAVYARQGERQRQREVLLQAQRLNPLEPVIIVNLAGLLAEQGEAAAAREQLQRALAIVPSDAALLRALADLELGQGHYQAAWHAADAALATDPQAPANIEAMLRLWLTLEDFDAAEALARQLPEVHRRAAISLQEIELRRGGSRLLPEFERRIAELPEQPGNPFDRALLHLAGLTQLRAGQPVQAAGYLRRASGSLAQVEADPERLDSASLLVLALERSGEHAEAQRWQQTLIELAQRWLDRAGAGRATQLAQLLVSQARNDLAATETLLEGAYQQGFRDRWRLLNDPRLEPLRARPPLQALAQRLDEEFAAARASLAER